MEQEGPTCVIPHTELVQVPQSSLQDRRAAHKGRLGFNEEGLCNSEAIVLSKNYPRPFPKLHMLIYSGNRALEKILRFFPKSEKIFRLFTESDLTLLSRDPKCHHGFPRMGAYEVHA